MAAELTLYEAMYILDPELSDEQLEEAVSNVHQYVASSGGEVESDELFGHRRLAYEINGDTEGIYRVMYFRGTGATVDEIRHEFGLMESVIRGMVVVANSDAIFKPTEGAEPADESEAAPEIEHAEPSGSPEAETVPAAAAATEEEPDEEQQSAE